MNKDIFEELEKSIDDAFKPNEKERVKKTLWDYYGTPTHNHKLHNHHDYMRNNVYDELMFGGKEHYNSHLPHTMKQINCRCGSKMTLFIKPDTGEMSFYRHDSGMLPYEQSIEVSDFFCSMCGERIRYYGKIEKVFTEV